MDDLGPPKISRGSHSATRWKRKRTEIIVYVLCCLAYSRHCVALQGRPIDISKPSTWHCTRAYNSVSKATATRKLGCPYSRWQNRKIWQKGRVLARLSVQAPSFFQWSGNGADYEQIWSYGKPKPEGKYLTNLDNVRFLVRITKNLSKHLTYELGILLRILVRILLCPD